MITSYSELAVSKFSGLNIFFSYYLFSYALIPLDPEDSGKKKLSSGPCDGNVLSWNIWLKARWWKWLLMTTQSSWKKIRLIGHLERGPSIISTDIWLWNVPSMSHSWKSAGSREDTIFMLRILFLATITGVTGSIKRKWMMMSKYWHK